MLVSKKKVVHYTSRRTGMIKTIEVVGEITTIYIIDVRTSQSSATDYTKSRMHFGFTLNRFSVASLRVGRRHLRRFW